MSKVSNVLIMLQLLQNGRKYSIKELSQDLEVSERMVRLYKEDLEKAGIYIDTIMGPYGGYVLNQNVKVPVRKFLKSDYEFLNNLNVNEEDREKLNIIADKIRGVYFNSNEEKVELKNDLRHFELKRINSIELLDEYF